jgi:hypothetical protein
MLPTAPIVAAVLGLAACGADGVVDPPLPSDAQLFSPPGVYSTWWNMTQACSGLNGSLAAVTWYKTDEVVHDVNTGDVVLGYWSAAGDQIVLTTSSMLDGGTVRHEMLHALLRERGRGSLSAGTKVQLRLRTIPEMGRQPSIWVKGR